MQQHTVYGQYTACQVLQALGAAGIRQSICQKVWPALVKAGLASTVPAVATFNRQHMLGRKGVGNKHQLRLTAPQLAPFANMQKYMVAQGLLYWPANQPLPNCVHTAIAALATVLQLGNVQQPATTVLQLGNGANANVQQATCSCGSTAAAVAGNSLTTVG